MDFSSNLPNASGYTYDEFSFGSTISDDVQGLLDDFIASTQHLVSNDNNFNYFNYIPNLEQAASQDQQAAPPGQDTQLQVGHPMNAVLQYHDVEPPQNVFGNTPHVFDSGYARPEDPPEVVVVSPTPATPRSQTRRTATHEMSNTPVVKKSVRDKPTMPTTSPTVAVRTPHSRAVPKAASAAGVKRNKLDAGSAKRKRDPKDTPAKVPSRRTKGKTTKPSNKENTKPRTSHATDTDSDSDSPVAKDDNRSHKKWSVEETTQLLTELLGVDSTYWERFQKNPNRIYKKVARKVFNNTRNADSVKTKYGRIFATWKAIVKFESWTGNGSGDPDVGKRLENARNAGVSLPEQITPELIEDWKTTFQYYDLFNYRLREDPTIERPVEHRSGMISELESPFPSDNDHDDPSDSDSGSDTATRKRRRAEPASTPTPTAKNLKHQYQAGVPTPAHKPRRGAKAREGNAVTDYLATTSAAMTATASEGKQRLKLLEAREMRAAQQEKRAAQQATIEQCRSILADDKMPEDSKKLAQDLLNKTLLDTMTTFN